MARDILRAGLGWASAALIACAACSSQPKAAPRAAASEAARVERPEDLLSSQLALVVRFDLDKLRTALGQQAYGTLSRRFSSSAGQAPLLRVLREQARTLWIGFRTVPTEHIDGVLLAKGDFALLDKEQAGGSPLEGFRPLPVGAPGVLVFERQGSPSRSAPAWAVMQGTGALLLATPALVEPTRQVIERGPDAARLDPPADGLLGFALRPDALGSDVAARYPKLRGLLGEVLAAEGSVDVEPGLLRGDVVISTRGEVGGDRVERVVRALLQEATEADDPQVRLAAQAAEVLREGPRAVRIRLRARGEAARTVLGL